MYAYTTCCEIGTKKMLERIQGSKLNKSCLGNIFLRPVVLENWSSEPRGRWGRMRRAARPLSIALIGWKLYARNYESIHHTKFRQRGSLLSFQPWTRSSDCLHQLLSMSSYYGITKWAKMRAWELTKKAYQKHTNFDSASKSPRNKTRLCAWWALGSDWSKALGRHIIINYIDHHYVFYMFLFFLSELRAIQLPFIACPKSVSFHIATVPFWFFFTNSWYLSQ